MAAKAIGGYKVPPILEPLEEARWQFEGFVGERITANIRQWLLPAPSANPAMLQILRDRDRTPHRDLVPWAGEFAGKYLISAVQALRLTGDRTLKTHLTHFVSQLLTCQDTDGYFGPFHKAIRMTGAGLWDLWGQYHVMLGLFRWYKATGDHNALAACLRCADYFCQVFLREGRRVAEAGSEEMNESAIHIFTLLYAETGAPRYLELTREIEKDWERPPSGDYVRTALEGKSFWQTPKPRWESLHSVQAIAELYFLTGEEKYRAAFRQIYASIVEGDRHNTGGFSSGEQATGNPYDPRPIETCCTIAWMCVALDYLRMTGDSRAADELELAFYNGVLGAQHPSGRWWTYNTPMDGERKASAHDIVFQARAGSPELNCCSVNGPRGLGMLSEWAFMRAQDGVVVNYYGEGTFTLRTPARRKLTLTLSEGYLERGETQLRLMLKTAERFTLSLRIPGWSAQTTVTVNGVPMLGVQAGTSLRLEREWQSGDVIALRFDSSLWFWVGEREQEGKVSIYRGPILLAYDPRFDSHDPTRLPAIRWDALPKTRDDAPDALLEPQPLLRLKCATDNGGSITLCDFASAGTSGNPYVSWLPASGLAPIAFSPDNPLRAQRPNAP